MKSVCVVPAIIAYPLTKGAVDTGGGHLNL
jgi:hypothetical protein